LDKYRGIAAVLSLAGATVYNDQNEMWYGRARVHCCMPNLALIIEGVDMEAASFKIR